MTYDCLELYYADTQTIGHEACKKIAKFLDEVLRTGNNMKVEAFTGRDEDQIRFTMVERIKTKEEWEEEIDKLRRENLKLQMDLAAEKAKGPHIRTPFTPTPFTPSPFVPYSPHVPDQNMILNTNPVASSELTGNENGL